MLFLIPLIYSDKERHLPRFYLLARSSLISSRNTILVLLKLSHNMETYIRQIIATFALGAMAVTAHAVQITGTLDIAGGVTLNTNSLTTATQVSVFSNVIVTGVTVGSILDTTINIGNSVAMTQPWVFGAGKDDLWSVGGFTFDLNTSTIITQTSGLLYVTGTGVLTGNGYDATPGMWAFTSQSTSGVGDNNNFSFSATTEARPAGVPDGGATAILLGSSLLGLALVSRKFVKRS